MQNFGPELMCDLLAHSVSLQACRCDRISPDALRVQYIDRTYQSVLQFSIGQARLMVSNALCMYGTVNSITVDMMHGARQVTSTNVEVALTF